MFIIGAFFVVAVLALLLALWLAYQEQQGIEAKALAQSGKEAATANVPVLVMEQEGREAELGTVALQMPAEERPQKETREPRVHLSRGQLLELALELRSLRVQAGEINERLRLLSTMVEEQIEEMAVSALELREDVAV